MTHVGHRRLRLGLAALLFSSVALPALAESPVTPERLTSPEPENWLTVHGTYDQWRFSPLELLTPENVGGLHVAFAAPLGAVTGSFGGESVPVVDDGFLYVTSAAQQVFKFNVQDGERALQVWTYDPQENLNIYDVEPAGINFRVLLVNRGVALSGDMAIANTPDGVAFALDRDSGEVLWERQAAEPVTEGFTAAPLAVKNMVMVGNNKGDWGTRGWAAALDAATGDEIWRFYMVPGPGEVGHETWLNDAWETGGAAIWTQPSYDPETNLLFYGTGNGSPAWDPEFRPGDNLFTASTVALNADTGELEWYHQYIANEGFEWDEITPNILVETTIGGEMRSVIAHHSTRNGYFYVIDRVTGEFVLGEPNAASVNWTEGFDPKTGLPIEYEPGAEVQSYDGLNSLRAGATRTSCQAASQWGGQTYNPELNRVYSQVTDNCAGRAVVEPNFSELGYEFGNVVDGLNQGPQVAQGPNPPIVPDDMLRTVVGPQLTAVDVSTGETVAAIEIQSPSVAGGTLGTASGLIFTGYGDGWIRAHDATTLEVLWQMNVGTSFKAPPITYAVGDQQYVAIVGGGQGSRAAETSMLWVFGL